MKTHSRLGLILIVSIVSMLLIFSAIVYRTLFKPMRITEATQSIRVIPGSKIHDLAKNLEKKGLISHPNIFIVMARIAEHSKKLRYGDYEIHPGMSSWDLLENIVSGEGLVKYQITFIEGWTFKEMLSTLMLNDNLFHRLRDKNNKEIMEALGYPDQHPEGRFMPETYTFNYGNTDVEILVNAYDRMQSFLDREWKQRSDNLPYRNAYEALIVASLIEKETSIDEERPLIASVILQRLKKRMRLQVDPTVLYGLSKSYKEEITRKDLRSKTEYNTYQNYGLPPTPIDMPSKASILAALHPANTNYLYYVSRGDGHHVFSTNYQDHLLAVKRYRELSKK